MIKRTIVAFFLGLSPALAQPVTIIGIPTVTDGDTIKIEGDRIRLLGIDAPELHQTCRLQGMTWACGLDAKTALIAMIGGKTITCELSGKHSYDRALGRCWIGPTDIGAAMVEQGWAVVDPRFEKTYLPQQSRAKAAGRGLWAGEFDLPCRFRGSC